MSINCEIAVARHENALRWYNLWNILTWTFGAFLIVILIYLVISATQSNITQSAIGLVGTVVDGVVVKWVVTQRATAYTEEKEAFEAIKNNCPSDQQKASDQRARFKIK